KITGKIVDSKTSTPIGYATLVVIDKKTKKQITGDISADNGKFKLTGIKNGTYELQISFLGYMNKTIPDVSIKLEKPDVDLGIIALQLDNVTLSEVEVVEEAPLVETKIDKIVYNAEKDVTNTGGDASDVLRKVPMLSVDLEGNVSLRGSQKIKILLNGKPSGMFSDNVADALKMIPADQIKKIEVITSPSAKYDGEGSAGIVNIITHKKRVDGYNGSIRTSIGTRHNNANLSFNAGKGRLGFNAHGGIRYMLPNDGTYEYSRKEFENNNLVSFLNQNGTTSSSRIGFSGRAGLVYDINAYNTISTSVNTRGFSFDRDGFVNVDFVPDVTNSVNLANKRNTLSKTLRSGFDWDTDYRRTFKNPDREFSIAFQINGNDSNADFDINSTSNNSSLERKEQQTNKGNNREYTGQIDYVHPFNKKIKLEIGGKTVIRKIDSDYQYELYDNDAAAYKIDPNRTNLFNYQQNVYAAYASFNFKLPKDFGLIAGARYEGTAIKGKFKSQIDPFDNAYNNILPSLIISKKTNMFSSIKLSYNQRIQRPSLFYINPYKNDSDRRNVSFGNPKLRPETVHQVEFGYNTFIKGTVLSAAVYYKNTQDLIESIVNVDAAGISTSSFQNIGINHSVGLNVFASTTIKKVWTVRGNFNIYTYNAKSNLPEYQLENNGIQYNFFTSSSFAFKKGWKAELFGMYHAPHRTLQGIRTSFWMTSLGIQKEIWKKRGSLGIRIVDPFNRTKSFKTDLADDNFTQYSIFEIPFRSFGLNFSYRFGKLDFKVKTAKSKIKNDDLKSGEGGDQEGGGNNGK
ncbi:MAG TPA: TonB-dependent receptor, partial [Saprospiraceae bacterium]|nr:TonB-dependent receptor [Saprospiraceae bacterium]